MVIPFWRSLAFWKALTYVVATVWYFVDPTTVVTDLTLLGVVQAILQLLGTPAELRAKNLW